MPGLDPKVPPGVRGELGWYAHRRQDLGQAEVEGSGIATKVAVRLIKTSSESSESSG
jgi:hypothetical protein